MRSALVVDSPIGPLRLASVDRVAVSDIRFDGRPEASDPTSAQAPTEAVLVEAARQLAAYFAGSLRSFDLPLAPHGTDFPVSYTHLDVYKRQAFGVGQPRRPGRPHQPLRGAA